MIVKDVEHEFVDKNEGLMLFKISVANRSCLACTLNICVTEDFSQTNVILNLCNTAMIINTKF